MSDLEYRAFNLVLAAAIGALGLCEITRPAWLTTGRWRSRYSSGLLYLRGGTDLIVAGLLMWPGTTFAASGVLLAVAVTVATAFLIDGEHRLAMVPAIIAVAAGANGYFNVR